MTKNLFGTDGIRTTVGKAPLSLKQLPALGIALAQWAITKYGKQPNILIACDTRGSASFIQAALTSGMLLHPIAILDAGILPTPALHALLKKKSCVLGIVLSASHNPHQDNGIKLIDAQLGKLSEQDELEISALFFENLSDQLHSYSNFGAISAYTDAREDYITHALAHLRCDKKAKNNIPNFLQDITVVLDCAHGATYKVAPAIFAALGAHVILINNQPTGTNINQNCGALHPEQLQDAVKNYKADIGFAFDGDGDRLVVVSQSGEIKNGDDILALLSTHPLYQSQETLVGTIMSNQGLAQHLASQGKKLIRTPVGDKYVAEQLHQNNLVLGGEQSGHIIMRDYLPTGDGIFTALRVLETVIFSGNWELTTFTKYPQLLINIPVLAKKDLSQNPLASIITDYKAQLPMGRFEIRYSGTENLLRVMIESDSITSANSIGSALASALKAELDRA
jgi:phosphoglucosamine mutase